MSYREIMVCDECGEEIAEAERRRSRRAMIELLEDTGGVAYERVRGAEGARPTFEEVTPPTTRAERHVCGSCVRKMQGQDPNRAGLRAVA